MYISQSYSAAYGDVLSVLEDRHTKTLGVKLTPYSYFVEYVYIYIYMYVCKWAFMGKLSATGIYCNLNHSDHITLHINIDKQSHEL